MVDKALLKSLPSVDEVLKSPHGRQWLERFPRRYVTEAVRQAIESRRRLILSGAPAEPSAEEMAPEVEAALRRLSSLSLRPVINATGIVVHTNLGRSALSERALENVVAVARGYSNLEYDLASGGRGKRYSHIKRLLREVTGAEDGVAVNNNAGAVLLVLNTLARGREVIVSRGELVEIGGSFRVPDVMAASGAVLREVGTTNKTHLFDYENAVDENTALILKVHRSNYRITGFTEEVPAAALAALGRERGVPVMYDLGSGCLVDLRRHGIYGEPSVQEVVKSGPDVITFSGDKLLGGPQAGVIVGREDIIERVQKNPVTRALRIDKLTLAALEATLMEYIDEEEAAARIPTLRMLLEEPGSVRKRARRIARAVSSRVKAARVDVVEDQSLSGGGALPEVALRTYAVAIRPDGLSAGRLEERLRKGSPPVIARIRDDALLLDARTVADREIKPLAACVAAALAGR
ncbi:MAG: L-seryl-tRNA(Sec) selenium transferase [Thermodesulfovibrionales bacterium]